MQQFVVPQFIDVEDKIFGPITVRQFLILLSGAILIFICNRLFDFITFIVCLFVIGAISLVFAFVKVKGQHFHYFLLNLLQTQLRPSLRIWHKHYTHKELDFLRKAVTEKEEQGPSKLQAKRKRIRDLSLMVNTGGYYRPEDFR